MPLIFTPANTLATRFDNNTLHSRVSHFAEYPRPVGRLPHRGAGACSNSKRQKASNAIGPLQTENTY